jgi:cobalamin biosynthesis protein CobD/CbiB
MLTKMHNALAEGDLQAKRALLSKVVARIDMGREGAKLSYTFPLSE